MVSRLLFAGLAVALAWVPAVRAGRLLAFEDPFDGVAVTQSPAVSATGAWIEKYPLLLTLRRETRQVGASLATNVTYVTNVTVSQITNLVISLNTNRSQTVSTNLLPPPPPAPATNGAAAPPDEAGAAPDGNSAAQVPAASTPAPPAPPAGPSISTNTSLTRVQSTTLNEGPGQTATLVNAQTALSTQVSVTTSNITITTADLETIVVETNRVILTVTNATIAAVTNVITLDPPRAVSEQLLIAEFVAPPDFTLDNAGPAILLVNHRRFGLTPTNTAAAFRPRRGFGSATFRLPAEALDELRRATNAGFRLKGEHGTFERHLGRGSLAELKELATTTTLTPRR